MREKDYLEIAMQDVAGKFKWPPHQDWKRYHLNRLSDEIYEKTGTRISLDTLRRLTGKKEINENYDPQPATKDAIALLLNYEYWEAFKNSQVAESKVLVGHLLPQKVVSKKSFLNIFLFVGLLLIIGSLIFVYKIFSKKPNSDYPFVKLIFNKAELPVPNTISLNYQKKEEIQDSLWVDFDSERFVPKEKTLLNADSGQINFCYRIPGYYKIKVTSSSGKVTDSVRAFIPGRGWSSFVYVPDFQFLQVKNEIKNDMISLNKDKISKYFYPLDNVYTDFRYFRRFNIEADKMVLKADIKAEPLENTYSCQVTGLRIVGEQEEISFDFNKEGCMAFNKIRIAEYELSGNMASLKNFEHDFSIKTSVKVVTKDKQLMLYLNGNQVYKHSYKKPLGKMMGLVFMFQGVGSIGNIVFLSDNGSVVEKAVQ